jgi:hypothetical protein
MKTILLNQLESCQINLMHTFKKQMSLFALSILIYTNTSFGQPAGTCNLLQNHDFTYSNSAALTNPDPFTFGYVPAWIPIQSPQLSGIKFSSTPSSALMWAGGYQYHEGAII